MFRRLLVSSIWKFRRGLECQGVLRNKTKIGDGWLWSGGHVREKTGRDLKIMFYLFGKGVCVSVVFSSQKPIFKIVWSVRQRLRNCGERDRRDCFYERDRVSHDRGGTIVQHIYKTKVEENVEAIVVGVVKDGGIADWIPFFMFLLTKLSVKKWPLMTHLTTPIYTRCHAFTTWPPHSFRNFRQPNLTSTSSSEIVGIPRKLSETDDRTTTSSKMDWNWCEKGLSVIYASKSHLTVEIEFET